MPTVGPVGSIPIIVRQLILNPEQRYLSGAGEQRQLTVEARDAENQNILPLPALDWTSSRPQDVSVDAKGLIRALVDEGFAEITVRVPGKDQSATLLISVSNPLSGGSSAGSSSGNQESEEDPFEPVNSEGLLVNSQTDPQFEPAVAIDPDGNALVVWTSVDGAEYDVWGRRYAADGSPQGEEFRINTFTTEKQYEPDVAALADGGFIVVWTGKDQDGSGQGIIGQRFDSRGRRKGDEFVLNDVIMGNQSRAAVASDEDGDYVVVWEDSYGRDGAGSGIYARHFSGSSGGTAILVNDETSADQSQPDIDLDADGDFVVAYMDDGAISARRFKAAMTPRAASFMVNEPSGSSIIAHVMVALDSDGDFTVVWKEEYYIGAAFEGDIYTRRYNRSGEALNDVVRIARERTDLNPDVVLEDDGKALVLWWKDDGGAASVNAQYLASDGSLDGEIFDLESETDHRYIMPRVARNADGQHVLVWSGAFPENDNGIGLKLFTPD